jgi:hypothetical protein
MVHFGFSDHQITRFPISIYRCGPQIQWVESFATPDKIYCVYIAPNERMVREHASQGGFPANKVSEIKTTIDPTTAESA